MHLRNAGEADVDDLAKLWYDTWHETHAPLLPPELTRHRTLDSFRERLHSHLTHTRVAGSPDKPVGFCIVKGDELYQLFISPDVRGTGVAAELLADAEARLIAAGVETAWLACALGNWRAARFYEKFGWQRAGSMIYDAEASNGTMPIKVWRFQKSLR